MDFYGVESLKFYSPDYNLTPTLTSGFIGWM